MASYKIVGGRLTKVNDKDYFTPPNQPTTPNILDKSTWTPIPTTPTPNPSKSVSSGKSPSSSSSSTQKSSQNNNSSGAGTSGSLPTPSPTAQTQSTTKKSTLSKTPLITLNQEQARIVQALTQTQTKIGKIFDDKKQEMREGKISAAFQASGESIAELGKYAQTVTKATTLPKKNKILKDPFPEQRELIGRGVGGIVIGAGESIKLIGDIVSAASKRQTWEDLNSATLKTGEYLIGVGKEAKIKLRPNLINPLLITPSIELSPKHKKDVESGAIIIGSTIRQAGIKLVNDPIGEGSKL